MASYTHKTARLTGPELNWDAPLTGPSIFGFNLTSNNPWQDEINRRRAAKFAFGLLGGPTASGVLSGMFKAQDKLNPNRPFYGPEKEEDPQETRDDSPAIAKERKKLWKRYIRLRRMADLEAYKKHVREFG
jgi:hypothetical protein